MCKPAVVVASSISTDVVRVADLVLVEQSFDRRNLVSLQCFTIWVTVDDA